MIAQADMIAQAEEIRSAVVAGWWCGDCWSGPMLGAGAAVRSLQDEAGSLRIMTHVMLMPCSSNRSQPTLK